VKYVNVAVDFPLFHEGLTYLPLPEFSTDDKILQVGQIVKVPLGKRSATGCIIGFSDHFSGDYALKPITEILPSHLRLTLLEIQLYSWTARYYHYSLGQLIFDSLPTPLPEPKRKKTKPHPIRKRHAEISDTRELSPHQEKVLQSISSELEGYKRHLIHGVTGSGKTKIYLEIMKTIFSRGRSVLYLLPEINLTPQFIKEFEQYLSLDVYVYHSELSKKERFQVWKQASSQETPALFIGVRSSVFLPINNLGGIIVDEEHDHSFKQEDRCPYNARSVAYKKAQLSQIPIILGSATPAFETWSDFQKVQFKPVENKFYHQLSSRVQEVQLPQIRFIDDRKSAQVGKKIVLEDDSWPLNTESLKLIEEAFKNNEQVLVFINRLGFANYVQCRQCGEPFHCQNCSVPLRFHKFEKKLKCHHCQWSMPMPDHCPKCGCLTLINKGFGVEKVLEVLRRQFPDFNCERFDREAIKTFKQLNDVLDDFHAHKIHLLVGTQMLSKGHNFKRVKKVIMLGIDQQLNAPDFRATERVYQTITQVAGRAGRFQNGGEVLIQTTQAASPLLQTLIKQDLDTFYHSEMPLREMGHSPPFYHLAVVYFSDKKQERLIAFVNQQASPLFKNLSQHVDFKNDLEIMGPRPALVEKRANQFTWTFLLKSKDFLKLHRFLTILDLNLKCPSGISLKFDIDPLTIG
jgi:primosomal protein N' (replication factor Y)